VPRFNKILSIIYHLNL